VAPAPSKRQQSVTPDGTYVAPAIDGVRVRPAVTHPDWRGTVVEVLNDAWDFADGPIVYVYEITIRPGVVKGWIKHDHLDDRLFMAAGAIRVVLYDDRPESPTYGLVTDQCFDDHSRASVRIPAGVFHAIGNVGTTDARLINCPTRAYNHEAPDKWDLPLENDLIPFRF
jgi:dTDP-4-dehydrorhamnose 3,5-epimerase